MKKHVKYLYKGVDLSFDDVEIDEVIEDVPEALQPTEAMQERFLENCVEMGILEKVTVN